MRRRGTVSHETRDVAPLLVKSFTFRTFHRCCYENGENQATPDRLVTVSLSAISGEVHQEVPTRAIRL